MDNKSIVLWRKQERSDQRRDMLGGHHFQLSPKQRAEERSEVPGGSTNGVISPRPHPCNFSGAPSAPTLVCTLPTSRAVEEKAPLRSDLGVDQQGSRVLCTKLREIITRSALSIYRNTSHIPATRSIPDPSAMDQPRDHLVFFVNGVKQVVRGAQPQTTLLQYLRAAGLTG